jgi:CRP/FNR family transcriptional regulator
MNGRGLAEAGYQFRPNMIAASCAHPNCLSCDVRRVAVCASVGLAMLPRLAAMASERTLPAEQMLFDEGDGAEAVFIVTDGMLKLYKFMADGRRQVVGFMVPGDFLGLAFGRLHVYSAEAVTAVALCRFDRSRFLELLDDCPSLEMEILQRTTTELAAAQEQMLLLGRKTATERVASFILCMSRRLRLPPGAPVGLPMSRGDIADYLGLTVETVSRTFSTLRSKMLIGLPERHLVTIAHPRQLEHLAGG